MGCFHWGWGEESLLTLVVVRRKMVHTSDKHQPNWFKFVRYSCCIISYPNLLSNLWFWFPWQQAPIKYCLVMKICGFSNTKWNFIYLTQVRFLENAPESILNLFKLLPRSFGIYPTMQSTIANPMMLCILKNRPSWITKPNI